MSEHDLYKNLCNLAVLYQDLHPLLLGKGAAINHLFKGKAACPSGISFDVLRFLCRKAPEVCEDFAEFFHNLVCLNTTLPSELLVARLIVLVKLGNGKKPDGIRPIAIGESIDRVLASIGLNRVASKAAKLSAPFQFGNITTHDASVAALRFHLFFYLQ
ncbi:hypothetical protein P9112_012068 [Eukaryota sp. TZLM1-RC]